MVTQLCLVCISVTEHDSSSQLNIKIFMLFLARLNMTCHYTNKIQNICYFTCRYKEMSVNKLHSSSVTRHTHYVYLYIFIINSTLSYTLTHTVFLLFPEIHELCKIFVSEYKNMKHSTTSLEPSKYGKL